MRTQPFRDRAVELSLRMRYQDMAAGCEDARSMAWWNNLVRFGAWGGPGHLSPPSDVEIPRIAKFFGRSEDQLRAMIAADWYGVSQGDTVEMSPRMRSLETAIDGLTDEDFELVANLVRRLQPSNEELVDTILGKTDALLQDIADQASA
jgi:hypothetical protein